MNILVINIARMGDILQSSPLVAGLKAKHPDAHIVFLVPDAFLDVAAGIPGVDEVVALPMSGVVMPLLEPQRGVMNSYKLLRGLVGGLQSRRFDRIINITHTNYSAVLASLASRNGGSAGALTGIGIDGDGSRVVRGEWANYYFNSCLNRVFNRFNLVDIHCRIAGVVGGGSLAFSVDDAARGEASRLLADADAADRLVAVVPAASTREKQYPVEHFVQALNRLAAVESIRPVLVGSAKEAELCAEVAGAIPGAVDLCGRTGFATLGAVLERCRLCITNDTGPMHMAAAVGTPVLDLSLGSALSWETAPYGEGHVVMEPRINCYPCLPKLRCSHFSCHHLLAPESVAEIAAAMLADVPLEPLVSGPDYDGINVFRTRFDREGWWELTPLQRRSVTAEELLGDALRELWKRVLDGRPAWDETCQESAAELGAELLERGVEPGLTVRLERFVSEVQAMGELARLGRRRALELAATGGDAGKMTLIRRLGDELKSIDARLVRAAHGNRLLMPLAAQFNYGKDNMTSRDLVGLARETADLYRRLGEWCTALPQWLEALHAVPAGAGAAA